MTEYRFNGFDGDIWVFNVNSTTTEGSKFYYDLTIYGILYNQDVKFKFSGPGITSSDFQEPYRTGNALEKNPTTFYRGRGSYDISYWSRLSGFIPIYDDYITEGDEKMEITFFSRKDYQTSYTKIGDSIDVIIEDTTLSGEVPSQIFYNTKFDDYFDGKKRGQNDVVIYSSVKSTEVKYKSWSSDPSSLWNDFNFSVINKLTNEHDALIGGIEYIQFEDQKVDVSRDILNVFHQLDGYKPDAINNPPAQIFRLYNAAFARFPDADGLRYWINDYKTQSIRSISSNFIISNEFISKYGQNNTTTNFVDNLYVKILGRLPDESGKNYWVNQIDSGKESRSLVLLGFSESSENKGIFTDLTGLK